MSPRRESPTLAEVIGRAMDRRLHGVHVAMPAKVLSYDSVRQCVTAQPLVQRGYEDERGNRQTETLPPVQRVPVVFPGAGGFRVTFPVAKGDTVLLICASQSIDQWLGLGVEVDPRDDRRHDLADAIAIPGLRSFSDALGDAPTDRMSLGNDTGPTIEITGSLIKLGSNDADDPVVLKTDLFNVISFLIAQFCTTAGHTHSAAGAGPPSPGSGTGLGFSIPNPPCATKVTGE